MKLRILTTFSSIKRLIIGENNREWLLILPIVSTMSILWSQCTIYAKEYFNVYLQYANEYLHCHQMSGQIFSSSWEGACLGQRDYSISPEVIARWRGKALSLLGRRGPFWSGKHVRGTVRSCLFSQSPQWPFLHVNHPLLHTCIIIVAVTVHFFSHFCFQYIVLLSTHNVLCLQQEVGWRGEQCLGSF